MDAVSLDFSCKKDEPFDIIQIGYAALEATSLIIEKKRTELREHFSDRFINSTEIFIKNNKIDREKLINDTHDLFFVKGLSDPGIFGGLWELAEDENFGVKINLQDILIRQETIEILEFFDANPYTYPSADTYIAAAVHGYKYVKHLCGLGYPAAVIGTSSGSSDRIVVNGNETRFLTPIDRLYKDEQEFNMDRVSIRKDLK